MNGKKLQELINSPFCWIEAFNKKETFYEVVTHRYINVVHNIVKILLSLDTSLFNFMKLYSIIWRKRDNWKLLDFLSYITHFFQCQNTAGRWKHICCNIAWQWKWEFIIDLKIEWKVSNFRLCTEDSFKSFTLGPRSECCEYTSAFFEFFVDLKEVGSCRIV